MKKIITVSLLTLALNATAGWGGNNSPWGNNGWSNGPWGGSNNNNGIVGNNPYSMLTPDWFGEEVNDMMDEFDSNNSSPWGNKGFRNGPWGNNTPWNNSNFGNSSWGNNSPWNNNSWRNSPWANYGYNKPIPTTADTATK